MANVTKTQLKQMTEELLTIQPVVERSRHLETEIKNAMRRLDMDEVEVEKGRVFISASDRMTVVPKLARDVLGLDLASKVIKVKESVSNILVKAFFEAGEITSAQMAELREKAQKTTVVNLHVRPLK